MAGPALCSNTISYCVANGKLKRQAKFKNIWIKPAAGGALGAALAAWHLEHGQPRELTSTDSMQGAYLGPSFGQETIERDLSAEGAVSEQELLEITTDALNSQCAVG